jgi:hypothetical protein
MRTFRLFACSALLTSGLPLVHGQSAIDAQTRQLQSSEQRLALDERAASLTLSNAPALYPSEEQDVGPQSILDIRGNAAPLFEFMADSQYFYTDNMLLSHSHTQSADVLVSTIQGMFDFLRFGLAGGDVTSRIGYRYQWFNYGLVDKDKILALEFLSGGGSRVVNLPLRAFDFNADDLFTDVTWRRGNWVAGMGFDFRRLLDYSSGEQFYRELTPQWTLMYAYPVCPKATISAGYFGDYRWTDTDNPPPGFDHDFNNRTDHSLFIDGTYAICKKAIAQLSYRFEYSHYTSTQPRDDYYSTIGAALYCPFCPHAGLRLFANYDIFDTDGKYVTDYNRFEGGVGLNLAVKF